MPAAGVRGKPKRKRARKARTAVVSSSSSSSSDSESDDPLPITKTKSIAHQEGIDSDSDSASKTGSSSSSSSSSNSSSNEDSSDDSSDGSLSARRTAERVKKEGKSERRVVSTPPPEIQSDFSESSDDETEDKRTLDSICRMLVPPTPVLRSDLIDEAAQKRKEAIARKNKRIASLLAKERQTAGASATREEDFQAVWMRLVVDEFGEELDALRKKEPTLATEPGSRMPLLIDALQAGSELFSRGVDTATQSQRDGLGDSDEVGLMLWSKEKPT